jgi:hypothetical protein
MPYQGVAMRPTRLVPMKTADTSYRLRAERASCFESFVCIAESYFSLGRKSMERAYLLRFFGIIFSKSLC